MHGMPFARRRERDCDDARVPLSKKSGLFGRSPARRLPAVVLWAWERPEDLRFLAGREAGVAFLAATVRFSGGATQDGPAPPAASRRPGHAVDGRRARGDGRGTSPALSRSQTRGGRRGGTRGRRLPRVVGRPDRRRRRRFRARLLPRRAHGSARAARPAARPFLHGARVVVRGRPMALGPPRRRDRARCCSRWDRTQPRSARARRRTAWHRNAGPRRGFATNEPFARRLRPRLPLFAGALDAGLYEAALSRIVPMTHRRTSRRLSRRFSRSPRPRPGRAPALLRADALRLAVRARTPRSAASSPASWASSSRRGSVRTSSCRTGTSPASRSARASRPPRSRTGRDGRPGRAGADAWMAAREAATGAAGPGVATDRWVGYSSYVNCGDDAFGRAAKTLQGYVERYGRTAPETRGWLAAQETVFANCSDEKPSFPEYLPASAPAPLRADRAYQLASASFYAGRLEEAQRGFEEIANDSASPWREIAPYLAGSGSPASGDARLWREDRLSPAYGRGARAVHGRSRHRADTGAPALVGGPRAVRRAASGSGLARRLRRRASPEAAGRGRVRGLLRPLPRSPGNGARPRARRSPGGTLRVGPEGRPDELDRGVSDEGRSRARPGARGLDADAHEPVARGGRSRRIPPDHPRYGGDRGGRPAPP